MTARRARLLVWAALLLACPVPLVIVGRGHLPIGGLAELAVVTVAMGVIERADGTVRMLAVLLVTQLFFWAVAAWVAADVIVRVLGTLGRAAFGRATLLVVVAGLVTALALPIYRSPFHASRARQTLLEVYR